MGAASWSHRAPVTPVPLPAVLSLSCNAVLVSPGAPTLASSWVSSAFNNTSSALAAADNAAAAAAADRLAVMMMLQQAAHTALQQQQQSPPSPPQQQQPQLHPEQAGGEVEQGQGKGEGQRQLDASMDATVAAQDQQQQLQQAAGGGGALPAPPPGAAAVRQSSVLSPQMGAGAGGPGAVEAASADWAGPRGSYDGWQGVGQGQRGGAGGRPLPLPPPSYRYGLMLARVWLQRNDVVKWASAALAQYCLGC